MILPYSQIEINLMSLYDFLDVATKSMLHGSVFEKPLLELIYFIVSSFPRMSLVSCMSKMNKIIHLACNAFQIKLHLYLNMMLICLPWSLWGRIAFHQPRFHFSQTLFSFLLTHNCFSTLSMTSCMLGDAVHCAMKGGTQQRCPKNISSLKLKAKSLKSLLLEKKIIIPSIVLAFW